MGDELEMHYRHVLEELGKQKGMLGVIFRKAQNKIQDPAKLRRLIVQGHGLGTHLLQMLIHVGRAEKFDRIIGRVHSENTRMQQLCRELGFDVKKLPDEPEYLTELTISKS